MENKLVLISESEASGRAVNAQAAKRLIADSSPAPVGSNSRTDALLCDLPKLEITDQYLTKQQLQAELNKSDLSSQERNTANTLLSNFDLLSDYKDRINSQTIEAGLNAAMSNDPAAFQKIVDDKLGSPYKYAGAEAVMAAGVVGGGLLCIDGVTLPLGAAIVAASAGIGAQEGYGYYSDHKKQLAKEKTQLATALFETPEA